MTDEETSPTPPSVTEPAISPQEAPPATMEPETVPIETPPTPDSAKASTGEGNPETAHSAPNEPLGLVSAGQATKSADSPVDGPFAPAPEAPTSPSVTQMSQSIRDLRESALLKKQELKRKKLDKIMEVLKTPTTLKLRRAGEITNDEVEKLLHVSDATATRYLSALEKDGKIKQVGKTGTGVVYKESV